MILDGNGETIGRLQDIDVDVDTDLPKFALVRESFTDRHPNSFPSTGIRVVSMIPGPAFIELVRLPPDLDLHVEELSQADE